MKTLTLTAKQIKARLDAQMEFGDVPSFTVEIGSKYIYVCRNDGSFHRTNEPEARSGGWATSLGRFTVEEAITRFSLNQPLLTVYELADGSVVANP